MIGQDSSSASSSHTAVATGYTTHDVLLGRHKLSFRHPGNIMFRNIIKIHAIRYEVAKTRKHKMAIVAQVKWAIEQSRGKFLQREGNKWRRATIKTIQSKISHALRDHITKIKGRPNIKSIIKPTEEPHREQVLSADNISTTKKAPSSSDMVISAFKNDLIRVEIRDYSASSETSSHQEPSDQLVNMGWVQFYARQFKSIEVENESTDYKKKEVFVINSAQGVFSLYVEELYDLDNEDLESLDHGIRCSKDSEDNDDDDKCTSLSNLTRFCLQNLQC